MANIPIGPTNTLNRTIGFTVADGTNVGPFFYIPAATISASIPMTATVIGDNTTTTAFFNFTDEFLEAETSTDMTDRLRCVLPPAAVDVYYSPSNDRVVLSGVDGYGSGHYISLAADSESYYGDTSPIQVANGNGQRCISPASFRGRSSHSRSALDSHLPHGNRSIHLVGATTVGEGVGPCGPRAVCVTNEFLFFVHRSGAYAYTPSEAQPKLLTKGSPPLADHQLGLPASDLVLRGRRDERDPYRYPRWKRDRTQRTPDHELHGGHVGTNPLQPVCRAGRWPWARPANGAWTILPGSVAVRCERQLPRTPRRSGRSGNPRC